MAHFAKVNSDNIVEQVIVIDNFVLLENGIEKESKGIEFLNSLFGSANWIQTSYNGNFRKQYAGIGFSYDSARDAFIPPKPFDSWILNSDTCLWEAPVTYPDDGQQYVWNEETQQWDLKNN